MSLTDDLYLEHKENCGNSIINRQMRAALSQSKDTGDECTLRRCSLAVRETLEPGVPTAVVQGGAAAYPPGVGRVTAAVTDTEGQTRMHGCWDCFGDVAVHIREFETHKNSHNAHSSAAPRGQRVHEPRG